MFRYAQESEADATENQECTSDILLMVTVLIEIPAEFYKELLR